MIKVLLVEDELLARVSLRTLIDWERHGYRIVGECADGEQAVPLIASLEPHIVITDVKMERMHGPELVRHIHQHAPHICAIVLSGYGDYQYVRDTLKHNALDYLIKNELTPALLLEVLEKARERLALGPDIERSADNLQALRQQFVLQLISGQYVGDEAAARDRLRQLHIRLATARIVPVLVGYQPQAGGEAPADSRRSISLGFSVCNVIDEILREQGNGVVIPVEGSQSLILLSFDEADSKRSAEGGLQKLLRRVDFCLEKFLRLHSTFRVGRMTAITRIDESYADLTQQRPAQPAPAPAARAPRPLPRAEAERAPLRAYSPPVHSAIQMIHERYQEQISLTAIAEKLGMNSSYLSTLFKAETGVGFAEYLIEVRLEHARALMDQGGVKLKQIISDAGFYSYQHFFTLFKKRFGMTPKEYMRQRCE